MRSARMIQIVSCHAEGEVGDVIIGGVAPPPGATLREQSRFLMRDGALRDLVLNEPRGGVFRHANLLVPPRDPRAASGFLIMEPAHCPPMSGSNAICVATTLLEIGLVEMREPETRFAIEAPGGLVEVAARCRDGAVRAVEIVNHPSFVHRLDMPLEVEGLGAVVADIAYGGDSFVIVDAAALGFALTPDEAADLAALGPRISAAATEQAGFSHPEDPDWSHVSFCQFAGPLQEADGAPAARGATAIEPGRIDRSPTGTGCSARMAVLHARGRLSVGDRFVGLSLIGSRFDCRIVAETTLGGRPAIRPAISGRAWISGTRQLMLDPEDPWPRGYRLPDTWPAPARGGSR